jgi:AcrR family transcriptional regulator
MGKSSDGNPDADSLTDEILTRLLEPSGREAGFAWIDHRQAALDELQEHDFPEDLVSAARNLIYHAPVRWTRPNGSSAHPALQALGSRPVIRRPKHVHPEFGRIFESFQASRGGVHYEEGLRPPLSTAGELLSFILFWNLTALDLATKDKRAGKRSTSPVRNDSMLSRRTISSLAIDMLEHCEACKHPPRPHLLRLFRALLQLDRHKLDQTRMNEAAWVAAHLIAREGPLTTRDLANRVGVNHGTISKWLKEPWFKKKIEQQREIERAIEARGMPLPKGKGLRARPKKG